MRIDLLVRSLVTAIDVAIMVTLIFTFYRLVAVLAPVVWVVGVFVLAIWVTILAFGLLFRFGRK